MNSREAETMEQHSGNSLATTASPLPFSGSKLFRLACSVSNLFSSIRVRRRERQMHLCETLPLGEKRLLALVEVGKQRFLIAATNQSISLLHSFEAPVRDSQLKPAMAEFPSPEEER